MKRFSKFQLALLAVAAGVAGWEFLHGRHLHAELAPLREQVMVQQQELAARGQTLEALEKRNAELQETERRAGNQTLLSLMRERNTVAREAEQAAAQAAAKSHAFGPALARTLESPEHRQVQEDSRRAEIRVGMYAFFKLANLTPEQREDYIDLKLQKERRQADRLSALLQGRMSVAEALAEQARDETRSEQQSKEVLGEEAMTFLNGIADGMRDQEAKRLLGLIQDHMGENRFTPEQGERLQALLKAEMVTINMDNLQLFRPPEEWTQDILARQQRILAAATGFLTESQLDTLKTIGAYNLEQLQKQMATRRAALGIK